MMDYESKAQGGDNGFLGIGSSEGEVDVTKEQLESFMNFAAEKSVVEFARCLDGGAPRIEDVDGIAFMRDGRIVVRPSTRPPCPLDDLPIPSWTKLPNEKYWRIGRIYGGREGWIDERESVRYAAVFTSRGCPYRCVYCHVSKERGGEAGAIGELRCHSVERVGLEAVHRRAAFEEAEHGRPAALQLGARGANREAGPVFAWAEVVLRVIAVVEPEQVVERAIVADALGGARVLVMSLPEAERHGGQITG